MAGVTTSSTLSAQYRAFFSKQLLPYAVQETILDQFCVKDPIPKNGGNKSITLHRWSAPSAADVQALSEGTTPASSTAHQLSLTAITKALAQYGHSVYLTDIMTMTELFNSLTQASKVSGQNMGLWLDTVIRNVLVGANLTASNGSFGSAVENGGSGLDNSDTLIEVYGRPASTTQSYTGLNSDTTTCTTDAATLLDIATKLKRNRAPQVEGGGYVYATDPRIARDLMRDDDWLEAAKYSDVKKLYKGEVGSLYGVRVVEQTNSFVSLGSATAADRYVYAVSGGGGTGTGKDIINSFMFGAESVGIPHLTNDSPMSPKIDILDQPDKSDPHNQRVIVATKAYFAALRRNPAWYVKHLSKTGHTL